MTAAGDVVRPALRQYAAPEVIRGAVLMLHGGKERVSFASLWVELPTRRRSPSPGQSSFSIPRPLSSTSISSRPCSRNLTAKERGRSSVLRTREHKWEGTHRWWWHRHRGHSRPVP